MKKDYFISCLIEVPLELISCVKSRGINLTDLNAIQEHVMQAFNALSFRDRLVLWERFGIKGAEERTLEEVGKKIFVTRERVRQIESKAIGSLADIIRIALGIKINPESPSKLYIPRKQIKKSKKQFPEFDFPYCREYESLRNKACRDLGCHYFPAAAPEAEDWLSTFRTHVRTCDMCQKCRMVQYNVGGNYQIK
jgi:hypothetical protein